MEFPLSEISNGLMHTLKEFEHPLFQISMAIGRVKIGRSSGNHGTVAKPTPASSSGNPVEVSEEETEILAEARRCCTLKNLANPIEKGLNVCAIASQIVECSSESCPILLNSRQHFHYSTYPNAKNHTILGTLNETAIRGM
jgi:hypothetical protein